MRLDQGNRRQKSITLQSIFVKIVGLDITGCHQRHAATEKRIKQSTQDHGIGDV